MGLKLESCRYGHEFKKVLESSWKQLWSHLGGRKAFRENLAMSCQYRSKNGGYQPKKQSIKAPANPQIFSDRRTIFSLATLLREVNFGTRYFF